MLRYVIALFLLNMYSRSLGAPTAELPPATNSLTDALTTLAKNCGNPFISKQIESMIQNCSQASVDKKKIFECLIFYDINNQLCYAINNSKLVINEDISAKVNQPQDVKDLCNSAKDWTFTKKYNLGVNLTTIFQDPAMCIKLCGVADVFSSDSVFYCKYYNWGSEKLKAQLLSTSSETAQNGEMQPNMPGTGVAGNQNSISTKLSETNAHIQSPIEEKKDISETKDIVEQNLSELANVQESPSTNPGSTKTVTNASVTQSPSNTGVSTSIKEVNDNPVIANEQTSTIVEKTTINGKNTSSNGKQNSLKDDLPKLSDDTGDDNMDVAGIDGDADETDDSEDGDIVPPQTVLINNKDIHISGESFSGKGYIDESPEDDHFFPFFLTAIILVVLLYVLYHNKGKVTKVFLGLIVEGRQNGRRRNSRGHAYRRLDTLEQAMSGNLAAQPSKIIY